MPQMTREQMAQEFADGRHITLRGESYFSLEELPSQAELAIASGNPREIAQTAQSLQQQMDDLQKQLTQIEKAQGEGTVDQAISDSERRANEGVLQAARAIATAGGAPPLSPRAMAELEDAQAADHPLGRMAPSPDPAPAQPPVSIQDTQDRADAQAAAADGSTLPQDFPGRAQLVKAGYRSLEEVQAATDEDLLQTEGIADARLAQIRGYRPAR